MFPLAVLLAVLALGLNVNAVQLNSYNTYAGATCSGNPTTAVPLSKPECITTGSTSLKLACGRYQIWTQASCQGTPFMDLDLSTTCSPIGDSSYKFGCAEFNNVVKVQFRYGTCAAAAAYEVYVEVDKCTPVSGQVVNPQSMAANQYSYKITQSGSSYVISYYYSTDCSGAAAVFQPAASGECTTTGSGSGTSATSQQSATIVSVGNAATAVVAGWATVAVAAFVAMGM